MTSSGSYYYAYDALGSTVDVTNSSGAVTNQYSYLPFGATLTTLSTVNNPFQYDGGLGVETAPDGLDIMGARAYVTSIGKFASMDPLGSLGPGGI